MAEFLSPEERRSHERGDAVLGTTAKVSAFVGAAAATGLFFRSGLGATISGALRSKSAGLLASSVAKTSAGLDKSFLESAVYKGALASRTLRRLGQEATLGTFEAVPGTSIPNLSAAQPGQLGQIGVSRQASSLGKYSFTSPNVGGLKSLWAKAGALVEEAMPGASGIERLTAQAKLTANKYGETIKDAASVERRLLASDTRAQMGSKYARQAGSYEFFKALSSAAHAAHSTTGKVSGEQVARIPNRHIPHKNDEAFTELVSKLVGKDGYFSSPGHLASAPKGFRHATLKDYLSSGVSGSVIVQGDRAFPADRVTFTRSLIENIAKKHGASDVYLGRDVLVYGGDGGAVINFTAKLLGVKKGDIVNRDLFRPSRLLASALTGLSKITVPFTQVFGGGIRPGGLLLPEYFQHLADPLSAAVTVNSKSRVSVIAAQNLDTGIGQAAARILRKTANAVGAKSFIDSLDPSFGSKRIMARYNVFELEGDIAVEGFVTPAGSTGARQKRWNIDPTTELPQLLKAKYNALRGMAPSLRSGMSHFGNVPGIENVSGDVYAHAYLRKEMAGGSLDKFDVAWNGKDKTMRLNFSLTDLRFNKIADAFKDEMVVAPANLRFGESLKQQHGQFATPLEDVFRDQVLKLRPGANESVIDSYVTNKMVSLWGGDKLAGLEYGIHKFARKWGLGSETAEGPSIWTKGFRWLMDVESHQRPLTVEQWKYRSLQTVNVQSSFSTSSAGMFGANWTKGISSSYDYQLHPQAYLHLTEDVADPLADAGMRGHVGFTINQKGKIGAFYDPTRTPDWLMANADDIFKSIPGYFVRRTTSLMDDLGIGAVGNQAKTQLFPSAVKGAGSASLAGFLLFKRVLPLAAAAFYGMYVDDQMPAEYSISAMMKKGIASMDVLRKTITSPFQPVASYAEEQMPGIVQSPGSYLARFGIPVAIGSMFGTKGKIAGLAAGFILSGDTTMTPEQATDIYEGREFVPIKKGRFWEASSGLYSGGRTMYFRPHILAQRGERKEREDYYKYSMFPTVGGLLAGYPGLFDPYAFERDNAYERPYPVTGPHALEEVPVIGSMVTMSGLGNILKPRKFTDRFTEEFSQGGGGFGGGGGSGGFGPGVFGQDSSSTGTAGMGMMPTGGPPGLGGTMWEGTKRFEKFAGDFIGIYGFAIESAAGAAGGPFTSATPSQWDTPRGVLGPERYFYEMEAGGGLGLTEFLRRVFVNYKVEHGVNPLQNSMPGWARGMVLAKLEYGDPYTRFPHPTLVPGQNYALSSPELEGLDPNQYPLGHQARILANVAPYDWKTKNLIEGAMELRAAGLLAPEDSLLVEQASRQNLEILEGRKFKSSEDTGIWSAFTSTKLFAVQKLFGNPTASEAYTRERAYGYEIPSWERPFSEFIAPTFYDTYAENGMLGSTLKSTLFGLSMGKDPLSAAVLGATGLVTGAGGEAYTQGYEIATGEAWKPEFRREEEYLNEYFDKLQWLKGMLNGDTRMMNSTVAGVNPYDAAKSTVLNAIGKNEREYFSDFLDVESESERSKILDIVPGYTKDLVRAWWNRQDYENDRMSKGKYEHLKDEYESKLDHQRKAPWIVYHDPVFDGDMKLPQRSWSGWDARSNLKAVKLQVIEQRAQNIHRFGFWQSSVNELKLDPFQVEAPESRGLPPVYGMFSAFAGSSTSGARTIIAPSLLAPRGSVGVDVTVEDDPHDEVSQGVRYGEITPSYR